MKIGNKKYLLEITYDFHLPIRQKLKNKVFYRLYDAVFQAKITNLPNNIKKNEIRK